MWLFQAKQNTEMQERAMRINFLYTSNRFYEILCQ
jgi:hypothetical protein